MKTFDADAVRDVFEQATTAMQDRAYQKVVECCDPGSLEAFKTDQLSRIESYNDEPMTVEFFLKGDPDMPREAAEYTVARINKQRRDRSHLLDFLPEVADAAQLRSMPAADVFARWLFGRSLEYQIQQTIARGDIPKEAIEHMPLLMESLQRFPVLGVFPDGERLAYVAYRREIDFPDQDDSLDDEDEEMEAELNRLSETERSYRKDVMALPVTLQMCRLQPDGSWRLIADEQFLGGGNGHWYFGVGSD